VDHQAKLNERRRVRCQAGRIEMLWEAWQLAREDARDASRGWLDARAEDRARAYWVYVAAADREAAAGALLSARASRLP
jgi:hypothetical protein